MYYNTGRAPEAPPSSVVLGPGPGGRRLTVRVLSSLLVSCRLELRYMYRLMKMGSCPVLSLSSGGLAAAGQLQLQPPGKVEHHLQEHEEGHATHHMVLTFDDTAQWDFLDQEVA